MSDRVFGRLLLALVSVLATVGVLLVYNPTPHLGGDNSGYIALAHGLLTEGTYTDAYDPAGAPHSKYPPLFPMVLAFLMALGVRTWAGLKVAAAVPTVLAVVLTFLWAERRVGPLSAFGVALLLMTSSAMLYYSQWILSDPLFLALTLGALWSFDRAADEGALPHHPFPGATDERVPAEAPPPADDHERDTATGREAKALDVRWVLVGAALAALASMTRSAGLPLVMAAIVWVVLQRRWRLAALISALMGVPVALWMLRGRLGGVGRYTSEFWMVHPLDPAQGTVGLGGLVERAGVNAVLYVLRYIPDGLVALAPLPRVWLGGVLALAAAAGWFLCLRRGGTVAEFFLPLYAGLILLWPVIWSGDRFALPLFPLVLVYAVVTVGTLGRRFRLPSRWVLAALFLMLLLPALGSAAGQARTVAMCRLAMAELGPWGCVAGHVRYYAAAATWASEGLPDGSVVMSRKPRHFYTLSGHTSRTFPFVDDPEAHLELADEVGARFVLLDFWDLAARRHVARAIAGRPDAYCYVVGFGRTASEGADLFGILPPDSRDPGSREIEAVVTGSVRDPETESTPGGTGVVDMLGPDVLSLGLPDCSEDYVVSEELRPELYSSSSRIPLLSDLDS